MAFRVHFESYILENKKSNVVKKALDSEIIFYLLLFLAVSSCFFYAYSVDKHLSADGVHYFTELLERKNFFDFAWPREFATDLTTWPLVIAINLGIQDISLLKYIFAAGLYFPYLLAFIISIYAVRQQLSLLLFPLLSIVMISFTADYMLVGEFHVMAILAWPILFLLLKKGTFNGLEIALLWGLLVIFSRLYETALIIAIIYIAILSVRFYVFPSKKQRIIHSITLLLCSLTVLIAIDSILHPRDPANKTYFLNGMIAMLDTKELWLNLSFIFLFTLGLWLRHKIILVLSFIPSVIYFSIAIFADHGNMATLSYAARTLSVMLLPLLLGSAIFIYYFDIPRTKLSIFAASAFILVMVVSNIRFTITDWEDFRQQFIHTLNTQQGYIPMNDTSFHNSPYRWGWNNPLLSLVWSGSCVNSIVLNPSGEHWTPLNPKERLILKEYIRYHSFFKKVDSTVHTC